MCEGHLVYASNIDQHKKLPHCAKLGKHNVFPEILKVNVLKMAAKVRRCEVHLAYMPKIDQYKKLSQCADLGKS